MRYRTAPRFDRQYTQAPLAIQNATKKQIRLLVDNWRHPYLKVHPYQPLDPFVPSGRRPMQARITQDWRMYYWTEGDTYVFFWMMKHRSPKRCGRRTISTVGPSCCTSVLWNLIRGSIYCWVR